MKNKFLYSGFVVLLFLIGFYLWQTETYMNDPTARITAPELPAPQMNEWEETMILGE